MMFRQLKICKYSNRSSDCAIIFLSTHKALFSCLYCLKFNASADDRFDGYNLGSQKVIPISCVKSFNFDCTIYLKLKIMDQPHISGTALILTGGLLTDQYAKTAHGLLRYSRRFDIQGVIDHIHAGQDAGQVLFGHSNGVLIFPSLDSYLEDHPRPQYAVIGMATKGGRLSEELFPLVEHVLSKGIHLINGLHQPLDKVQQLHDLAYESGAIIYDIRQPKGFDDMHFWKGEKIKEVRSKIIPLLGLDCAVGKRTTSRLLVDGLQTAGLSAEMIYTGQTGWMQGGGYGFLFDATPNDFIPGELEHALYQCYVEKKPDVIIIEGQSGLRNPSGPCGLEFILSGEADGVILQAKPSKMKYKGLENYPVDIPDILDEVELLERFDVPVIGLSLSGEGWTLNRIMEYRDRLSQKTQLPIGMPLLEPLDQIIDSIIKLKKRGLHLKS